MRTVIVSTCVLKLKPYAPRLPSDANRILDPNPKLGGDHDVLVDNTLDATLCGRAQPNSTGTRRVAGGKRGRRTTYLGRSQNFPLRRVESNLAAGDRGFGLSGVADTWPGRIDLRRRVCLQDAKTRFI